MSLIYKRLRKTSMKSRRQQTEKTRLDNVRTLLNNAAEKSFDESGALCSLRVRELNRTINDFAEKLPNLCEELPLTQKFQKSKW